MSRFGAREYSNSCLLHFRFLSKSYTSSHTIPPPLMKKCTRASAILTTISGNGETGMKGKRRGGNQRYRRTYQRNWMVRWKFFARNYFFLSLVTRRTQKWNDLCHEISHDIKFISTSCGLVSPRVRKMKTANPRL